MTRRRLRRRCPPGAAQATGPLLRPQGCWRIALRATALRAALDPGDLGGPWQAGHAVRPRACPGQARGARPQARGNLITAEPPGEAASHKTRCARNPGCSIALAGGAEVAVDLAGDVTLQAADDLFLRLAFLGAPLDVDESRRMGAHPCEHDPP